MKTWIIGGIGVVIVLIGTFLLVNKVSPVGWGMWGNYNTTSGIALKGYDPVSYFNSEQPTSGDSQYTHEWRGAIWQFANAENMKLFIDNPESYAPQFGGFCSFAVSKGFTADISPEAWHIEGGDLFVFADKNVRDDWVAGLADGSLLESTGNWAKR